MEALKMETPMTEWNDDRLDELNGRVKDGFAKVDQEMKEGFANVDRRFEKVAPREETLNAHAEVMVELRRLNDRFDRLLHTLMVIGWGFAGTVLAALIGAVAVLL
jgi:hypothetical protein